MSMKKGQGIQSIKNQELIFKFYELIKKEYENRRAKIFKVQHSVAHSRDPEPMAMTTCSANTSLVKELRGPETQDSRYQDSYCAVLKPSTCNTL